MEHIVKKINIRHIILLSAILLGMLTISGCGNDFTLDNGAENLFVVLSDYNKDDAKRPIDDLLKLTELERAAVSYEVEDTGVINIDSNGKITTTNTSGREVTYVTVRCNDSEYKVKVVVVGDYNPGVFSSYSRLYIPYGTEIIDHSYSGSDIEYLNIPSSVTTIAEGAFSDCSELREVSMLCSIKDIPTGLFYDCTSLKYISLPSNVNSIGESAFRNCDSIETIDIGNKVTYIDSYAFYSCHGLTNITLPESLNYIGDRAFCNCSNLKEITIPNSITKINDDTFSSCSALSRITLPNSIVSIGERAFLRCISLDELTIPESVNSLGLDAFSGCIGIKDLTMPLTLPVDKSSFPSVANIEHVRFTGDGDGFNYSSANCIFTPWYISRNHKIKVDIDEGITSIGDYTFVYCYGLVEINLPQSLNKICHGAFRKCFNLETIVIPDNVTSIELHAFSLDYELENITLPKNLYEIGPYAFYGCKSIKSLDIPNATTVIGEYAYSGCNNIEHINIGNSSKSNLKVIGVRAFAGLMFNCKEVNINSSKVKFVASGAFGYLGDEKPAYTIGTLSRNSVIKVSGSIKNKFVSDKNYYSKDTKIVIK